MPIAIGRFDSYYKYQNGPSFAPCSQYRNLACRVPTLTWAEIETRLIDGRASRRDRACYADVLGQGHRRSL